MTKIKTYITLPPALLSVEQVSKVLELTIDKYHWIKPKKYGDFLPDLNVPPIETHKARKLFLNCYHKYGSLQLSQNQTYLQIVPDKYQSKIITGYIILDHNQDSQPIDLAQHVDAVFEIVNIVNSPLAIASSLEAYRQYSKRKIPLEGGGGHIETLTVKDCAHGLQYAHWRMWFGREYINFFGKENLERIETIKTIFRKDKCFTQVINSPSDWDTPSGQNKARLFIESLAPNTFYNPNEPERELVAPDFSELYT